MNAAIIVAAGKGTRMGPDRDKLFLEVANKPIVAHTWEKFERASIIDEVVLVVRDGMQPAFETLAGRYGFRKTRRVVAGGAERQDSVWNGLEALGAAVELVAIHDGARPCVSSQLIDATIEAARETGAAVAAGKITDTIKEADEGGAIRCTVDRSRLWSVQTPQTFRVAVIRQAILAARERGLKFTDDTAACELIGQPVKLVECASPNPKVTVPGDLPYIEWLLSTKELE